MLPNGKEFELTSGKIVHKETGSHIAFPCETIERVKQVLPKLGVAKLEQIPPEFTDGVPIFRVNEASVKTKCHRHAWYGAPQPTSLDNPPQECFGKGMTLEQSQASALMEAVERYSGQRFSHSNIVEATYDKVGALAVAPSQFNFPTLPLKCFGCAESNKWCFPRLEEVSDEWSWGYSLVSKSAALLPSALVYYPYISKHRSSFTFNDTGGLAAGNSLEEAVLQGTAEVVERDAQYYSFNLGNLGSMRMVDFSNTQNVYIQQFLGEVLPAESVFAFQVENKKFTLDIPAFSAFVCYVVGGERRYFGGSGASLNPEVALLRALTELEQQKARQKAYVQFDRGKLIVHEGWKQENIICLEDIPNQSTGDVSSDIELCSAKLSRNGLDMIVSDLTHPEIGIPVTRVVIPKLISYSGSPIRESIFLETMKAFGSNVR